VVPVVVVVVAVDVVAVVVVWLVPVVDVVEVVDVDLVCRHDFDEQDDDAELATAEALRTPARARAPA
jgi:hypothetical protein